MAESSWTPSGERSARFRLRLVGGSRRVRLGLASLACAVFALALGAGSAQALVLSGHFGSQGSADGQFQTPVGVGVEQSFGLVYVADSANARVELFSSSGKFILAFGWGVSNGQAKAEICTSNCQKGIPGSGPGQFSNPTSVAVDSSGGPSNMDVYVGDQGNNVVQKFNFLGGYLSTINGSTTPQGNFSLIAGVAVDQAGNLWVADGNTDNISEFDQSGKFLQQWNDTFGQTVAMTVDSTNGLVYAIRGAGTTQSFTLTGTPVNQGIDNGSGQALALDPATGNLYVGHGGDVVVYDKTATQIDSFTLPGSNSKGMAFGTTAGSLYVSDATNDNVVIFGAAPTPSSPLVFGESGTQTGTSTATVNATVVPFGLDTTCSVQFVDDATFKSSGYDTATSVPCTPSDLGSGFANVSATADLTGLSTLTTYHFRFVATNSDGTTNGADSTFETGGPPAVVAGSESASSITDREASVSGSVIPNGLDTTCIFQYVDDGTFQASGYSNAQSVPCSPSDLGSSFSAQTATGSLTGLAPATTYHFRVEATNSAATTDGPDQTFKTHQSFLVQAGVFGSSGTADAQFFKPIGVASGPGGVFVADSGNARVERFTASGSFVSAWGFGVSDGKAQSEVCTSNCQAGIPGPGGGQFETPTGIATRGSRVYVGDPGTNQVDVFNTAGTFLSVISGATSPQGHFQGLTGVAVDQSGNVWASDGTTSNVLEFNAAGKFLQQWSDSVGSPTAIAADSSHAAVYLINGGTTTRFTTTGTNPTTVDSGSGTALALDPSTGNLYVDHGSNVAIYDHTGLQIDFLYNLGFTTNSQGLAYRPASGAASRLYVTDASNNFVTLYGPRAAGRPFITTDSATQTGKSTATLNAAIVPLGHDTTCIFQFVDDATFQASGYTNATTVPCTPADLGSSFTYAEASANLTGLASNTTYHFRVVATNSAGTTTSGDLTFQQQFAWPPVTLCPVDDPAMLATTGAPSLNLGPGGSGTVGICLVSNSPSGSITIGNTAVATGNTNLQVGLVLDNSTGVFTAVAPSGGAVVEDPVQIPNTPVGTVTAVTTSAGTPSNFSLLAGISTGMPIITIPIKIQLQNPTLGPSCFLGSDQSPILLQPENTDLSNAMANFSTFDPSGVPDPNGPLNSIEVSGAVQGDNSFAVPGAQGCGPNGDGSLDSAVDTLLGLPSPAGSNHLVLDNAFSGLVIPLNTTGQQFSTDWHTGFG
jgi:sugar lactone lactonase YvrE